MPEFPMPIVDYMCAHLWGERTLAYFLMDKQGRVLGSGGALEALQMASPKSGQNIADTLLFMEGLLPLEKPSLKLPCVKMTPDVSVDVHLFRTPGGYGLLLADATHREADLTRFQQKAHELVLLREKHAKIINKHLGRDQAGRLLGFDLERPVGRKRVTILLADIRRFRQFAERKDPLLVFRILREYFSAMIGAVVEEGGVVDKIIGDAVMAIFGVLPSNLSPAVQSLNTASRILQDVKLLGREGEGVDQEKLHVGVGIASGQVVMGILDVGERLTLNVIGDCVDVAACLENKALPGQVIIDKATYDGAGLFQKEFTPVRLDLKGMASPLEAFAWEFAQ